MASLLRVSAKARECGGRSFRERASTPEPCLLVILAILDEVGDLGFIFFGFLDWGSTIQARVVGFNCILPTSSSAFGLPGVSSSAPSKEKKGTSLLPAVAI
jgi:hypothetical protein